MPTDLILGTAGHIDHGKTSLVKALTGIDTDRLPEEKKRGITIELGFAELDLGDYRLGIVDVPGHERFVRNMLAGATGIDVAMLVIAADDSVKPQTREHLEILRLLGIEAGVIALTKCDLSEPDWLDLVEDEVRELVSDTFLSHAPLVRVSAFTGFGLDALKESLTDAAELAADSARMKRIAGPFRMAIDRAFTVAGHGTVVTGSVGGGKARVGDELAIEPGGLAVRVRGIENHGRTAGEIHRGQRAAINLAGVHHDQIGRGQELCAVGHLVPSRLLTVQPKMLDSAARPLKGRSRVKLHLGTAELSASVGIVGTDRLEPGQSGFVQLFLGQPVVATWGQPIVIRSESPAATIGGGTVVDPNAQKIRRGAPQIGDRLSELVAGDPLVRASAACYFAGFRERRPIELARAAGIDDPDEVTKAMVDSGDLVPISISPTRSLAVDRRALDELGLRIEATLERLHAQSPLAPSIDRSKVVRRFEYLGSVALVDAVLARMQVAGRLRLGQRTIALAGHGPQLSANEQKLMESIVAQFETAGFEPPTVAEIQAQTVRNQAVVPQLVDLAAADGALVKISPEMYLAASTDRRIREILAQHLAGGQGLTMSQIREILATTRKYAVPICEHLDRTGFTRREGDLRFLR